MMHSPIDNTSAKEILALNAEKKTIREKEFVEKWLLTLHEYHSGVPGVAISYWLTGMDISPYMEVSVVDQRGEVLFDVPSILVSKEAVFADNILDILPNVVHRTQLMEDTIPGSGSRYFTESLLPHVREQTAINEARARWDEIFIRYGLTPAYNREKTIENKGSQVEDAEFEEYEDL